jgi:dTDP-4-dehydrorhamnose 3,5-epimerase
MMEKFKFAKTDIPGVIVIEPHAFKDGRGFFMEFYNKDLFEALGFADAIVQANHSRSKKGVVRGMHYQLNPHPMGKLIKVIKGKIFDAGVDIRKGSPTFGKWHGEVLSGENHKMLYFPPGFAHGFLALEDDVDVVYLCTGTYSQKSERAILWNDPEVGIKWPLDKVKKVVLSEKDKKHPGIKNVETNFSFNP